MKQKRKQLIYRIIGIMLIMGMGFGNSFFIVSALNDIPESPQIYIDSRLKLWDSNEKMLDKDFNITLLYYNETNNHSFTYKITINEFIYSGNATYSHLENITIVNTDIIFKFDIEINNELIFSESGILITSGINRDSISNAGTPFTINLNPAEWSKKEWNIFFSLMFAGVLGMVISYKIVKRMRKKYGVKTIQ